MNQEALKSIQEAITAWKNKRNFTYEHKQVFSYKSPMKDGEVLLRFTNSLKSFYCNQKLIEISLASSLFHTGTLSDEPMSDNPKGDKYRLEKILEEFDRDFYAEVERKLSDCTETLKTTDPLFF